VKELRIITPFTDVNIRSKPAAASVKLLEGRWAALNSSGEALLPADAATGVYLIVEGLQTVKTGLAASAYDVTTPHLPTDATNLVNLPSAVAANQVALAYGIFLFSVTPVGFVLGTLAAGKALKVDDSGRLIEWTSGVDPIPSRIAIVEAVSADLLVARTLGN
jgi:hypothetical protein